ncbi:hypothetical protein [Deinococcus soli (ex Cha et al. 2016)]|uniref:hypothetical protein n=1 Tax=Deinococcus soli (ex Cha et al. 2016) TaxID=1309411 RepID=UPI001664FE45|nr:hypothetical protein [Deinococcus soli (ex Cha et al. 2016)]GGB73660.1 hypothetical protein GCM10008019_32330 [Deinococcus soli (ex Cha et al. 2016)]
MTNDPTPTKRKRKVVKPPTTPAAATPPDPQAPTPPPTPVRRTHPHPRGPNPNRLDLGRSSAGRTTIKSGARLVHSSVDLSAATRRAGGRPGSRHTTITIISAPNKDHPGAHRIGVCIKDETGLRFDTHPCPGPIDDHLPLVLENAVLRCPGLRDLIITTPYKHLWNEQNHTRKTRDYVRHHGCRIRPAHPMPYDLGHMLARTAASGHTGPTLVDYHLYTASLTDGERTYASGILYGRSKAYQFTQTTPGATLPAAEAAIATWAFALMPEHSDVMIHNASAAMQAVWTNPASMTTDVRDVMKRAGHHLRLKNLKFRPGIEPYLAELARVAREIASHAYAGANLHRKERA